MIAAIIRSALVDEALQAGLRTRIDDMRQRLARLDERGAKKRQLALEAMCDVGLKKLEQPDFTASARAGLPSLIIMSEGLVPDALLGAPATQARSSDAVSRSEARRRNSRRATWQSPTYSCREDKVMAFTEAQLKCLEAKLDAKHVRTRRARDTTLAYVEGWHVIAEANRIFGYDAWDRHTLSTRCVWSGYTGIHHAASYTAKVRIVVRAGALTISREGCGSGEAKAPSVGEAHELALKAAETDATKRALATFGNPFGLALYDRELAGVKNRKALTSTSDAGPWLLSPANGAGQSFTKADEFVAALRKALTEASDVGQLFAIWEQNVDAVRAINRRTTQSTPRGAIAQNLVAHLKGRAIDLAKQGSQSHAATDEKKEPRSKIDKSVLTIGEPKRIRSKEHLRFVASQPCLICGRTPAHAHHIRYAQARGLALKVSDEFTVPLCAIHHSENHSTGDERRWWAERKIDPLVIAKSLWNSSLSSSGSATPPVIT